MGFYLKLTCGRARCGFSATIGNATEFYLNADGVELPYGHPLCLSPQAAKAGIAGYWRNLLCWECGRADSDSVRLAAPIRDSSLAWAMFPPGPLHPRFCPDCGGILCDIGMLHMFLEYRADPEARRRAVRDSLAQLRKKRAPDNRIEKFEQGYRDLFDEPYGPPGDPVDRLEAELKVLENVHTEEEMILHQLGLMPELPVTEASMARLADKLRSSFETAETLHADMSAKMMQAHRQPPSGTTRGSSPGERPREEPAENTDPMREWFRSPAMKAKRALDRKTAELRELITHMWIAEHMLEDEQATLNLFRRRCPKCRTEPLKVSTYQT